MKESLEKYNKSVLHLLMREVLCRQLFWPIYKKRPDFLGLGNDLQKRIRTANILAMQGQLQEAAMLLAEVLSTNPENRDAAISLGAILSLKGVTDPNRVWSRLSPSWFTLEESDLKTCFPFYCACIENLWSINANIAKESIKNFYYPFFAKYEMLGNRGDKAFFFWHLAKSGGTSLHETVGAYYYRSGLRFVPSYTSRRFLAFLVRSNDCFLPFLSSAHLPASLLDLKNPSYRKETLLVRDPVDRAISAYRQYRSAPESRLNSLPQHGFLWDFLPVKNSRDWVDKSPQEVLNPIGYTFGSLSRIEKVDEIFNISALNHSPKKVVSSLGCEEVADSMRSEKNSTNKKIKFSRRARELLRLRVAPDDAMIRAVKTIEH